MFVSESSPNNPLQPLQLWNYKSLPTQRQFQILKHGWVLDVAGPGVCMAGTLPREPSLQPME